MSTGFTLPGSWPMFRALVGIGVICSLLIVIAFIGTKPIIEKNRAEFLDKAIATIFPNADTKVAYQISEGRLQQHQSAEQLYAVYDQRQQLQGFAIQAQGMGYQDAIHLLYGYAPQQEAIVGIKVLASRETPGLGDRIDKDPVFLKNFERLDVRLTVDKAQLLHEIESVKAGEITDAWQIDSITGATISSRAVADILKASTAQWLPSLARQMEDF